MISETLYEQDRTILQFPDGARAYAHTFSATEDASVVVTDPVTGARTIPAGTIYPANDATATGVVLKMVDVTSGSASGALLFVGDVRAARLPEDPTDDAKRALPRITWFPEVSYPAQGGGNSTAVAAAVAALAPVSVADATDAATAAELANANKTAVNAIIAALKA
jgi:hypothetical protein